MARIVHREQHFTSSNFVRDVVIGMSDGLTVPFALAAGLSGAISNTRFIVIGGLAEIAAGSIAMGLGGYLAARGDAEHFEQLELLFPAGVGLDDQPPDAVAEEAVGERLLAVLLGVDDFALERQLGLAHLEVERAVGRQERGDRVTVFVEKAADGFVL